MPDGCHMFTIEDYPEARFNFFIKLIDMLKVADILKNKGMEVYSITGTISVFDALKIMGEKNIGALPVIENNELKGIFSERDYARKIVLQNRRSRETQVKEIMTEKVVTVSPGDTIDHCMETMSAGKFRHLPVLDNERMVGIISIGDVVTAVIQSQKDTISHLQNYISQ